jgi:hypothetical protein
MPHPRRSVGVLIIVAVCVLCGVWAGTKPDGPDLAVRIRTNNSDILQTTFYAGQPFPHTFPSVVVKNIGNAVSKYPEKTTLRCRAVLHSGPGGTTPPLPVPAEYYWGGYPTDQTLKPAEPIEYGLDDSFKSPLAEGQFVLSATADSAGDVSKGNNFTEVTITVVSLQAPTLNVMTALTPPTLLSVERKSPVEYSIAILSYQEHSVQRRTKGVIIERKSASGGYQTIAKTAPTGRAESDSGNGIQRTYQDGPLSEGTYTYRMKAYDDKGESGYSNEASISIAGVVHQPLRK